MNAPKIAIEPERFRDVLGRLPTGVTVITAHGERGPVGMACNSFTSASLEPPLVALFPARTSTTWPHIRAANHFCANIMASHHEAITRLFAARNVDRFAEVEHHHRQCGPGLSGAVAWIDCRITREYEAGDHTVVLAEVLELEARDDAEALVFWRGGYGVVR